MKSTLERHVPAGPVRDLAVKVLGTNTPTSGSEWERDWHGRIYYGRDGRKCKVQVSKSDLMTYRVAWSDEDGEHEKHFRARITWEDLGPIPSSAQLVNEFDDEAAPW